MHSAVFCIRINYALNMEIYFGKTLKPVTSKLLRGFDKYSTLIGRFRPFYGLLFLLQTTAHRAVILQSYCRKKSG